ncbi:MAG: hypothetical protein FJW40_14980 [Acidobacteria bacterium]|nr:hypothetical protein [Acidobacteriota bacterium]
MILRAVLASALLAFQIAAILYARTAPTRYFCWAPFDMQTDFEATAIVQGRELTPSEIRARYRRPHKGSDNRSAQHVFDMFEQTERRYHAGDPARITIRYRVNGKEWSTWQYPRP